MSIKDWPESERPRERLLAHGADTLTEADLLAICLRTGLPGRSALELARAALDRFGSLRGLLSAHHDELIALPGFGPAKAAQLIAVLELARRALKEDVRDGDVLATPAKVREYLRLYFLGRQDEAFVALYLDAQNRLLEVEELFRGTLTQTSVYPRVVVRAALRRNAGAVIFAHNHPSGVAEPSRADELLTHSLKDALALVEVQVVDHIIVTAGSTLSFVERGLL
ncbi:MAG: DNA repair protein RadC [Burkholderiales bacterium]|jgi:DNA repair protein RadC|nr:DNA repair protein RadC [Burkholderiales bacterium]